MSPVDYSYGGRDLFASPETYEYAQCVEEDFLVAWRRHREMARQRLVAVDRQPAAQVPSRLPAEVGTPLNTILDQVIAEMSQPNPDPSAVQTVDALLGKFEIFRRVFSAYTPTMTKAPGSMPAGVADYVKLAEALVAACHGTGSPKYLSTLLKLTDALCSLPAGEFSPDQSGRLASVLDAERRLVDDWERRVA